MNRITIPSRLPVLKWKSYALVFMCIFSFIIAAKAGYKRIEDHNALVNMTAI